MNGDGDGERDQGFAARGTAQQVEMQALVAGLSPPAGRVSSWLATVLQETMPLQTPPPPYSGGGPGNAGPPPPFSTPPPSSSGVAGWK